MRENIAAPAIAFERVGKSYPGARTKALDGVSLEVAAGEFLAVIGASGSGKSTLLSLINRLTDPSEGHVRFQGEDTRDADPILLRRRIGYVFQGVGLFPHMTVAETSASRPACSDGSAPVSRRASTTSSTSCSCPRPPSGRAFRTSCREAKASASGWRGRSPPSRAWC
jgi:ABC-type Fe3+/spermidine/putrescine transport system ATPase subunit